MALVLKHLKVVKMILDSRMQPHFAFRFYIAIKEKKKIYKNLHF